MPKGSRCDDSHHHTQMMAGQVTKRVTCVEQVSDRILAVKISAMQVDMLIVQI